MFVFRFLPLHSAVKGPTHGVAYLKIAYDQCTGVHVITIFSWSIVWVSLINAPRQ